MITKEPQNGATLQPCTKTKISFTSESTESCQKDTQYHIKHSAGAVKWNKNRQIQTVFFHFLLQFALLPGVPCQFESSPRKLISKSTLQKYSR